MLMSDPFLAFLQFPSLPRAATCAALVLMLPACSPPHSSLDFSEAEANGKLVQEGYARCLRYVDAWLEHADPATGLIPQNLNSPIWNGHNSAADNYPFMVLTTYLLDKEMFHGRMTEMLETEIRLTSRLGSLPDDYSFETQGFLREEVDMERLLFGASEYMKDGLLPITEYMGPSPWSDRMLSMLDEFAQHMTVAEGFEWEYGGQAAPEINGELLQILTRMHWMTGKQAYLDWAVAIGDYYLLDPANDLTQATTLRLRDHGCEIIGGLGELYATLHFQDPEKKAVYQAPLYQLLDRILEVGVNEHGVFFNEVNMQTGTVEAGERLVDNWGYLFNTYYTLYQLDGHEPYRAAVLKAMENMNAHYLDYDWESGSSDGYADAIEGGLNLYNREPVSSLQDWLDASTQIMWSLQDSARRENAQAYQGSGIIEGWHGDGNFARTTIMYCLWKTQGVYLQDWRDDLQLGAVQQEGQLLISLLADKADYRGKLAFDHPRHQNHLNMPFDYPRINQFPEWFTVKASATYELLEVRDGSETSKGTFTGQELMEGIDMELKAGQRTQLALRLVDEYES